MYLDLEELWDGINMKNFLKKITGLDKEEQRIAEERAAAEAERQQLEEQELELLKKKDPKEYATRKKEPWVGVLETHIDTNNLRNGFFELDWNKYFIVQLIQEGYGSDGDSEESIVDRWFRTLCTDVANEEGIDMSDRAAGYINVNKLGNGKSEVS